MGPDSFISLLKFRIVPESTMGLLTTYLGRVSGAGVALVVYNCTVQAERDRTVFTQLLKLLIVPEGTIGSLTTCPGRIGS